MRIASWQERLDDCRTEAEVVEIARGYLASFDYFEIGRLPDGCRPVKLVSGMDVSRYAVALAGYPHDEREPGAPLAHRLAAFFIQAHMKLASLEDTSNDGDAEAQRSA